MKVRHKMKLGNVTLRNSFLMSAVKTGYGDSEGNISERHLAFWDKRSKHVAAVILNHSISIRKSANFQLKSELIQMIKLKDING